MNLLSTNDLLALQTALDAGLEISMTRTMGDSAVKVRTLRVGYPWPEWVHTIMQVRKEERHIVQLQNFTSVRQFREMWRRT